MLPRLTGNQAIRWLLKPALFATSLQPCALLLFRLLTNDLGADPQGELTSQTGLWTLRFIVMTLAITPLRRLTGFHAAIRFRRMLGLFAFFYGSLHLLVFVVADRLASLGFPRLLVWRTAGDLMRSIGEDVFRRPYITVGFTAWSIMAALASTSTSGMIRRLGGMRWQRLHRLVYVAAIAGVLHYWWSVKVDVRAPQAYAAAVATLLAYRTAVMSRGRRSVQPAHRPNASGVDRPRASRRGISGSTGQ